MSGPLSLTEMETSVQVLRITAPDDNLNALTMSPNIRTFTNLEEIHITKSNVPILGQHFFYGLKRLLILDLSQNNITQPLDHNFNGLNFLQELYLDDNRIYSLPSGTFRYLKELRILSIQRNKMQEMPPSVFQQLDKLQELKISGNLFGVLSPEVFKDIKGLRKLECRACGLSSIDQEIYKLIPDLIHLDLGENNLKQISPNEYDYLTKLKSLKLDGNQIHRLTGPHFQTLWELRKLNLAKNEFKEISRGAFKNLTKLNEIDLSFNDFEKIDSDIFQPFENSLEKLILNGNHLRPYKIKQLVQNLKVLKNLQLSECGLTDFEEENFVPETLLTLNLAGNYLSMIPPESIPYSLIELDLSKNRFKGFREEVMQRIENTPKLKLDLNPWSCDLCYIFPLISRVNKSEIIRNLRCASPFHFENKQLGSIRTEELNWCSTPTYQPTDANLFFLGDENKVGIIAAGASVVLLVLTILSILGALIYSRRHAAKYYTHEEKRSPERESIFENQTPLFDDKELSFKFPLDPPVKKISIATIDELKKEQDLLQANGT
nr:phospholipase A2 inhibitor-like [Onthophagus taurus]